MLPVQPHPKNITASALGQITAITSPVHPGKRGVSRSSRTRGWMRVDAAASGAIVVAGAGSPVSDLYVCADDRRFKAFARNSRIGISPIGVAVEGAAYGEVVWFWHPWLMSSQRRRRRPDRA